MTIINENFLKLKDNYLFSEISKRVTEYKNSNSSTQIIKLGIGDVVKALPECVIEGLHEAVDDMAIDESFKGYGPEQGYEFLRNKIVQFDYVANGISIEADEIFISDGAKCDTGNICELFSNDTKVAVCDPVYPVYVDSNLMAGREIFYLKCQEHNNFIPQVPTFPVDIIFLCYPNNPTGTTISKDELKKWIDYAIKNNSIILYDAAYEAYITDSNIPHSIFELDGAREVAIEFRSYSKSAGFTGLRCAYTVVPKKLFGRDRVGNRYSLNKLWQRRQATKFNGVSYPVQKAAFSLYSEKGQLQMRNLIDYYMENAQIVLHTLKEIGFTCYGGENAPYIWIKTPENMESWTFFDFLLSKLNIVCTPGAGFGSCGEGFIRISAFSTREDINKAMNRFIDNNKSLF